MGYPLGVIVVHSAFMPAAFRLRQANDTKIERDHSDPTDDDPSQGAPQTRRSIGQARKPSRMSRLSTTHPYKDRCWRGGMR